MHGDGVLPIRQQLSSRFFSFTLMFALGFRPSLEDPFIGIGVHMFEEEQYNFLAL